MAKRRSEIGKKGKHGGDRIEIHREAAAKRRRNIILTVCVVVVILAVISILAYYFLMDTQPEEKQKEVLTTNISQGAGHPDEEITFGFTIYNPEKESDTFSTLISGLPSDWEVSLPETITVQGKKTVNEDFFITPSPATALNKTYAFMLNVTSENKQHTYTLEYEVTVLQIYGVELSYNTNFIEIAPGESAYYLLEVNNTGNGEDTINFSFNESQLPENWTVSFEFDSINILAFSSKVVICNITTFSNTSEGIYVIDIIATSSSGASASIWLSTSLLKVLTTNTTHKQGYPGEDISFNFTIYNHRNETNSFSPLISGLPADWTITLPGEISIDGNESENFKFSITPSSATALNKTYSFILSVTSDDTQHTSTLEYKLTVYQTYGVELLCYNNSHDADPGRSTYYALMVKNTGNGDDTIDLSYNVSQLPNNWDLSFEFDPVDISGLNSKVVIVNITTSSGTPKGIYNITINATSSHSENASISLNTSLLKDFDAEIVEIGDKIQVHYIGTFNNGSIFDRSTSPLKMIVGSSNPPTGYINVIEGFWEGAIGMEVNETKVVRLSPEKGYNDGLWRIFEITLVSIDG